MRRFLCFIGWHAYKRTSEPINRHVSLVTETCLCGKIRCWLAYEQNNQMSDEDHEIGSMAICRTLGGRIR